MLPPERQTHHNPESIYTFSLALFNTLRDGSMPIFNYLVESMDIQVNLARTQAVLNSAVTLFASEIRSLPSSSTPYTMRDHYTNRIAPRNTI